jgi:hypothetical protein
MEGVKVDHRPARVTILALRRKKNLYGEDNSDVDRKAMQALRRRLTKKEKKSGNASKHRKRTKPTRKVAKNRPASVKS